MIYFLLKRKSDLDYLKYIEIDSWDVEMFCRTVFLYRKKIPNSLFIIYSCDILPSYEHESQNSNLSKSLIFNIEMIILTSWKENVSK